MQGTQYAPRESILCMEHFVALQSQEVSPFSAGDHKAALNRHERMTNTKHK